MTGAFRRQHPACFHTARVAEHPRVPPNGSRPAPPEPELTSAVPAEARQPRSHHQETATAAA
jgi:hypothetical protein